MGGWGVRERARAGLGRHMANVLVVIFGKEEEEDEAKGGGAGRSRCIKVELACFDWRIFAPLRIEVIERDGKLLLHGELLGGNAHTCAHLDTSISNTRDDVESAS